MTRGRAWVLSCGRAWVLIGALGCGEPAAPARPAPAYHLVGPRGAQAFADPGGAARDAAGTPLLPGFGFSVVEERVLGGVRVARTRGGKWLRRAALVPAVPSKLAGVALGAGTALEDLAWLGADAPVSSRATSGPPASALPRLTHVRLAGPCEDAPRCRTTTGWIDAAALIRPRRSTRPLETAASERWIDVDLARQTLVAYQGDAPVFATLVSTGIGRRGSPLATPVGSFRIHTKRQAATMDNLEHTGVVPYSFEDVPHVQVLTERVSLHGASWHDRFGRAASHGCINVSPADAAWLWDFTSPAAPRSGHDDEDVYASAAKPGTLVRVR